MSETESSTQIEDIAARLYLSDPDQGMGHGAWAKPGMLSDAIKEHYRTMAARFLQPCPKCGPLQINVLAGDQS
ncbi:hypothetical protein [Williamsia phyllosphaerae]|nr:hypothetical protein [Williamsia phyllosphaerae]